MLSNIGTGFGSKMFVKFRVEFFRVFGSKHLFLNDSVRFGFGFRLTSKKHISQEITLKFYFRCNNNNIAISGNAVIFELFLAKVKNFGSVKENPIGYFPKSYVSTG